MYVHQLKTDGMHLFRSHIQTISMKNYFFRKWELVLCDYCGSQGTHLSCSGLEKSSDKWECNECKTVISKFKKKNITENIYNNNFLSFFSFLDKTNNLENNRSASNMNNRLGLCTIFFLTLIIAILFNKISQKGS